jgi:hypothetical protein
MVIILKIILKRRVVRILNFSSERQFLEYSSSAWRGGGNNTQGQLVEAVIIILNMSAKNTHHNP